MGAHEVITTIMLNWIAYWGGSYLFARDGPLQNHFDKSIPISDDVADGAKLSAIWGNPALQALHSGIFVAIAALVVFYLVLNRTTLGYEVRAVGYNPEAARYGGISVGRNFVIALAISGAFAGLAGGLDIVGWQHRLGVLDVQVSQIGFIGIAVALLGRNTAVGVGLAALLFGGLLTGTSTRSLDPTVFPPQLAGNLALMIQALVLLFVGADLLIVYAWQARKRLRRSSGEVTAARETGMSTAEIATKVRNLSFDETVARVGIGLGLFAFVVALPSFTGSVSFPPTAREFWWPAMIGLLAIACGVWAVSRGVASPRLDGDRLRDRRHRPRRPGDAGKRGKSSTTSSSGERSSRRRSSGPRR